MKKKIITRIAICAVLAALYFVLDLISIKAGPFKLSVSGLPIIIVAVIYGPIDGMIVGFVGAFLGQLLSYGFTPTTILWVLPAVLRGLIVGVCFRKQNVKNHPIKLMAVVLISSIIVTTTNTFVMYIDSVIYDYYSYAYIWQYEEEKKGIITG
jgi:ECF transporter S component (folate family)